jgi:hypothetical protein
MEKTEFIRLAPAVKKEMLDYKYWLENDSAAELMSAADIKKFNQLAFKRAKALEKEKYYCDLKKFPEYLSREEIYEKISLCSKTNKLLNSDYYNLELKKMSRVKKNEIIKRLNLEKLQKNKGSSQKIYAGVLIKRSNLRAYPAADFYTANINSQKQDSFQLTALSLGTPVLILHKSINQKWLFIQAKLFQGWIKTENIAFAASRNQAFSYLETKDFLMVTGSWVETESYYCSDKSQRRLFQMGDRIALLNDFWLSNSAYKEREELKDAEAAYHIVLPAKDRNSRLYFRRGIIAFSRDLKHGFLTYSRKNLVRQAFKMLGERYGWGGIWQRRDCSRFVMDIYRTVGIELPRDTGLPQEKIAAGPDFKLAGSKKERKKIIAELEAGDLLYLEGHVMIYLGRKDKKDYVIHAAAGYGKLKNDKLQSVDARGVFIMELEQLFKNGAQTYLESLRLGRKLLL